MVKWQGMRAAHRALEGRLVQKNEPTTYPPGLDTTSLAHSREEVVLPDSACANEGANVREHEPILKCVEFSPSESKTA